VADAGGCSRVRELEETGHELLHPAREESWGQTVARLRKSAEDRDAKPVEPIVEHVENGPSSVLERGELLDVAHGHACDAIQRTGKDQLSERAVNDAETGGFAISRSRMHPERSNSETPTARDLISHARQTGPQGVSCVAPQRAHRERNPMGLSSDVESFLTPSPKRFAEVFMNADPNHCGPVDLAALKAALPRRRALFESAGAGPLRLVAGEDQDLGDGYVLARTTWKTRLRDGEELELRSTYILRRGAEGFEIVFYLNHQDLPALLTAHS
jgi:hypothetical protein